MFFVANKALTGSPVMTSFGPFASKEAALAMIQAVPMPGEYIVYGPAEAVHAVTISAPTVVSTAL